MSDREQWRFQWPDGTWIRWNPQTQSWEKEDQSSSGAPSPAPAAREIPKPTTPPSGSAGWQPVAAQTPASASPTTESQPAAAAPGDRVVEKPSSAEPAPSHRTESSSPPERAGTPEADVERAAVLPSEPMQSRTRTPRSSAPDVLPPRHEPERPGGSLWPTIVAGAAVGVGVGLLLSAVIR